MPVQNTESRTPNRFDIPKKINQEVEDQHFVLRWHDIAESKKDQLLSMIRGYSSVLTCHEFTHEQWKDVFETENPIITMNWAQGVSNGNFINRWQEQKLSKLVYAALYRRNIREHHIKEMLRYHATPSWWARSQANLTIDRSSLLVNPPPIIS